MEEYELWVREDQRGRGVGKQLVRAAEDEGQRRGCRIVILDTYGGVTSCATRRLPPRSLVNWTGPKDRFSEFLARHSYDPELIGVFNYGYEETNGKAVYDNVGDMQEIAHRLDEWDHDDEEARACSVDRLSRDSITRGGPSKVIIIAHSSGGLIARHYLTRQRPDEFGTRYRGNVSQLIM